MRRDQYRRRTGRELGEDNIWVIERRRELRSLEAIIERLSTTGDEEVVSGAGTGAGKRLPLLQIQTRGAHQSALDKAQQPAPRINDRCPLHRRPQKSQHHKPQRCPPQDQEGATRDAERRNENNPNSVARRAGVARKTIYNHTDLFDEIRAASATSRPTIAVTESEAPTRGSSVDAALRQQLRTQKRQYDNDIAALKAEIRELDQQLAAAYGEIHRLRGNGAANNS